MARRAAPFHVRSRNGLAHFDATIRGRRYREALEDEHGRAIPYASDRPGREDSQRALAAAQKLYADIIGGRTLVPTDRVLTEHRLDELCAIWLDAIDTPRTHDTVKTKKTYVRTWLAFTSDDAMAGERRRWAGNEQTQLERLVEDAGPADYAIARLRQILRKTVRKELTAMFEFFEWAKTHRHLGVVPQRPKLPKGNPGVRAGKQRAKPVDLTPAEAHAIIAHLPEWSSGATRKGWEDRAFRVRDVFDFMWEMTWRPSTLKRISVPRNWSPGSTTLVLEEADDKALYGREVTLTARAKEILERVAPASGPIFGGHDYRKYLKAAAAKVLPSEKAKAFARYDFRHGRINNLLEVSGNMPGVAQVAGHKQLTTTNAYLRSQQRQGTAVIDAADASSSARPRDGGTFPSLTVRCSTDCSSNRQKPFGFPVGARGFEPPTPRPPGQHVSATRRKYWRRVATQDDKRCVFPHAADRMPSPFGHALGAAQRSLVVERATWDAFDAFALAAAEA